MRKNTAFSLLAVLSVTGSLHSLSSFDIWWNLLFQIPTSYSLSFFHILNLLRAFLKSLLKIRVHKNSHVYWACQQEAGQDKELAAADGLGQFPRRAVLCYRRVAEALPGLFNHPSHPTAAPSLCHSCPGCAQGQSSHVMEN